MPEPGEEVWARGVRCPGSGRIFFSRLANDAEKGICPCCGCAITVVSGRLDYHIVLGEYLQNDP